MYVYTKIIDKKRVLYGTTANIPSETDLPVVYFRNDWSVITDIGDYKFFYDNEHQIYGNDSRYGIPTENDLAIYPYVESIDGTLTPIISAIPGDGPNVSLEISPTYMWLPAGSSKTLTATASPSGATITWLCSTDTLVFNKETGTEVTLTNSSFESTEMVTVTATATYLGRTVSKTCSVSCSANSVDLSVHDGTTEIQPSDGVYEIPRVEGSDHAIGIAFIKNKPDVEITSWNNPQSTGFIWEYEAGASAAACRVEASAQVGDTSTCVFTLDDGNTVSVTLKVVESV